MGQLVEAPLDAEVGVEGEREHAGVGREVAAGVVAHQQHRALGRDALEAAHLAAEPEAGEQPQAGQRLADVVGIALVEVGLGHPRLDLARDGAHRAADQRGGVARARQPPRGVVMVRCAIGPMTRSGTRRCATSDHPVARSARSRRHPAGSLPLRRIAVRVRRRDRSGGAGRRGRGGHDARATVRGARRAARSCAARPGAGRSAARGSRAGASCSRDGALAVSITSLRRLPLIRLRPITARSSPTGWMSTTSVPPARTRWASLPRRRPDAARVAPSTRSSGFRPMMPAPRPHGWRWGSGR